MVIERVSVNYSLRKKGGAVGATATLVQFPIKVAHAITAHKIQGQTIPKPLKVAFDVLNIFDEAQGYVMLSRVQEMEQVYLIDGFDPDKIYPSKKALNELERMNSVSWNNNPSCWNKDMKEVIKILSLNCAGIKPHFEDIKTDVKLRKADIITLLETSLLENDKEEEFELLGYSKSSIKSGNGKGIITFFKSETFTAKDTINSEQFQIAKHSHENIDVIGIYRSQIGNCSKLIQDLKQLIDERRVTIIIGDFNICYRENTLNKIPQGLKQLGFKQLVHEPTHIQGRIIDHAYLLDPSGKNYHVHERYSPYFTDHDGICVSIMNETIDNSREMN